MRSAVLLTALFCFSINAAAKDPLPRVAILDWFPFGWVQDGQNHGMLVEIVQAIDSALEIESDAIVAPVPRVMRGIEEADFDFTITYRNELMLKAVEYLVDIGCLRSAIISMKSKPVSSVDELTGLRVAYPGAGYFAKRFLPSLNIYGVEVAQTDIMFRMALRGRLDAFIINDAVWSGYRTNKYQNYIIPSDRWQDFAEPYYMETLPIAISMSKLSKQQALGQRLKGVMQNADFVADLSRIYEKYALPNAMQCLPAFADK